MLAEILMLRLEAIQRGLTSSSPASSDSRFVPFKLPTNPVRNESQQSGPGKTAPTQRQGFLRAETRIPVTADTSRPAAAS